MHYCSRPFDRSKLEAPLQPHSLIFQDSPTCSISLVWRCLGETFISENSLVQALQPVLPFQSFLYLGIASAFGAPIGGVLFSLNEASSYWSPQLTWKVFVTSMCAFFTMSFLLYVSDPSSSVFNNPYNIAFGYISRVFFNTLVSFLGRVYCYWVPAILCYWHPRRTSGSSVQQTESYADQMEKRICYEIKGEENDWSIFFL